MFFIHSQWKNVDESGNVGNDVLVKCYTGEYGKVYEANKQDVQRFDENCKTTKKK